MAQEKAIKKSSEKKKLLVTQIASPIRRQEYQAECLKALGLGKMHRSKVLEDNPIVQGLITKVRHMIRVESC